MDNTSNIPVTGSYKKKPAGTYAPLANKDETVEVTLKLRRKNEIRSLVTSGRQLSHQEFEDQVGADAGDLSVVEKFAKENRLHVENTNLAARSVQLSGSIADLEKAFNVTLGAYSIAGLTVRGREGDVFVPAYLSGVVTGVFGLDNRPAAYPMFQRQKDQVLQAAKASNSGFTANQLAAIYRFPTGVTGAGQTIGIIELGGGYKKTDITNYFKQLGIPAPKVTDVLVDKAKNAPTNPNGADGEVLLDIEIAGAVAPGAHIVVYFAPNTDQGFLDAISTAVHDTVNKPAVISISWGQAESSWTSQSLTAFDEAFQSAAVLGVTVCVAAGDTGSNDGVSDGLVHVDFPASSPHALACGGTTLKVSGQSVVSETVWHDSATSATGGGVSEVFPLPAYQQATNIPVSVSTQFKGRGLPDVAANADPNTGYSVLVDGQQLVFGGTSAVAPLMAGLVALLNQQGNKAAGFINPVLYANPGLCRDITSGDNKTTTGGLGYTAGPGWDACSGWGVLSSLTVRPAVV